MRHGSLLVMLATLGAAGPVAAGAPEAIQTALAEADKDLKPDHYEVQRADLDGDGDEDALALTIGKSRNGGSVGCTLFVLRADGESFEVVSAIKVVTPPIYLRATKRHGWHDLVVRVQGGGATPHFTALSFDGKRYPPAPGEAAVEITGHDKVLFEDPLPVDGHGMQEEPVPEGRPAQLEPTALKEFASLPAGRRKVIEAALRLGRERLLDEYVFGSADPERGGFDCSGSIYYVLRQCGLEPPRSSAAQFDWIKEAGRLVEVPADVASLDAGVFAKLRPGDLLFWSGTYEPTDGRTNQITHVQMYLGTEKEDARPVMIGSSDGRSYRGKPQCGYGVFDFRLPRQGSKSHFAGFGSPPGIDGG